MTKVVRMRRDAAVDGAAYLGGAVYAFADTAADTLLAAGAAERRDEAVFGPPRGKRVQRANTICVAGDSIPDRAKIQDGTTYYWVTAKGFWSYVQQFNGHRHRLLNVASFPGEKIAQTAARLQQEVIAYGPARCLVSTGINNAHAWQSVLEARQDWEIYKTRIIERLLDADIIPRLCTLPPSTLLNNSARQQGWYWFNQTMREYASLNSGIELADIAARTYTDPDTGYSPLAAYVEDEVHPNSAGAVLWGRVIAELDNVVAAIDRRHAVQGDPYNGASSSGLRFAAANNAGSRSGTPSPAGSNNIVTGFTLQGACTNGTGVTITPSIVAAADGGPDWQQVVLSGSGMSGQTNCAWLLNGTNVTLAGSEFSVGDWVEGLWEVEVDAGHSNLVCVTPLLSFVGAANGRTSFYSPRALNLAGFVAAPNLNGVKAAGSLPIQIPDGTTAIKLQFEARHLTAVAAASSTIRIRNPLVRHAGVARAPGYGP